MNFDEMKSNKVFMIITLLIVAVFSFTTMRGGAYWQSSGVQRNAGYTGPRPHSGYGARFYHK